MTEEILGIEDTLDSREVIARIEDLRENRDTLDNAELIELDGLIAFDRTGRNIFPHTWDKGVTLILEFHFTEYTRELAGKIGVISPNIPWLAEHIDWEKAAERLKRDYVSIQLYEANYWTTGGNREQEKGQRS